MGSSMSMIQDNYESYLYLCGLKHITPLGSRDSKSFYDHAKEIIEAFTPQERIEYKNNYSINSLHDMRWVKYKD